MKKNPLVRFFVLLFLCWSASSCRHKDNELTFGAAEDVWWAAPTIIAETHQLFSKHGVNVRSFDTTTGLASKNAVVSHTADIGLVAATPLAMGAYQKEDIRILCTNVESKSLVAFLKRKSPPTESGETVSLISPVAIIPRTISEWYFINYLKKNNLMSRKADIKELHVKPADVPNVLKKGDANSGVIWEPFASFVPTDQFEISRDPDLYTVRLFLISRQDVLDKKGKAVENFIAAVAEGCALIAADPDKMRQEMETRFHNEPGSLRELWGKVDFSVKYDFDTMRDLILRDAQIAVELGYTPRKSLPEVDYMFPSKPKNP